MTLIIRFVDRNNVIPEEFLQFIYLDSGLRDCGNDMNNCRGQGYDGGGNMAGVHNGCDALITKEYPLAIYFHCASHRLNLSVQKICTAPRCAILWTL